MKIYYAHCIALYGGKQEGRDLITIDKVFNFRRFSGEAPAQAFVEIIDPSSTEIAAQCDRIREVVAWLTNANMTPPPTDLRLEEVDRCKRFESASDAVMELIFKPLAQGCDVLVFRALPDGSIPSGVAKEITWAQEAGKIVMELPSCIERRLLTISQTREYLREIGQR